MSKRLLPVALLLLAASLLPAQERSTGSPSEALAGVMVAACRQNAEQFAKFMTADNAAIFEQLPPGLRAQLMQRFIQLNEAGRPLLSTDADSRTIVRCDTASVSAVIRFGPERVRENLAFVPVEINNQRRAEFGLVREAGAWKVISVGLLLLNLAELSKQWSAQQAAEALEAGEAEALANLRRLRAAIQTYRRAFGTWPTSLAQLGPPPGREGASPERARLLDEALASGLKGGYAFAFRILPAEKEGEEEKFEVTATPAQYGTTGRRSFLFDAAGILRAADKQGAVATAADPPFRAPSP